MLKIFSSVILMSFSLVSLINFFEDKLIYHNFYKSFYLVMIVLICAAIYLLPVRISGLLEIKNFN